MDVFYESSDIKKDIDIKNYVKFILRDGEIQEKRDILENISERIVLKKKTIHL